MKEVDLFMMQLSRGFYVKCDKCRYVHLINPDDLECESYSYERSMGMEVEYIFNGEIECEECNNFINFNIRGYEYPIGAFNYSSSDCDGGEFLGEPSPEILYELDEFYYDKAYEDYIRTEELLEYNENRIKDMSPRDFEFFVANIFRELGYSVKVTQSTRDGGKDIIATKAYPVPFSLIIECKHWRNKVDISVIRSVYGVQVSNKNFNKSVVVTSSTFTRDARKFADEQINQMTLWDIGDLLRLIEKYQISL